MPPHKKTGGTGAPSGGNQLLMDGSVKWHKYQDMLFLHSWNPGGTRDAYFFQEDIGEGLMAKRDQFRAKP